MTPPKLLKLFCIASLFLLNSCGIIIRSYIKKDTDNVPPDFGKGKTTILVVNRKNHYNKKVDKIIRNHYTGDYMFVSKEELDNKYKDAEDYRYILNDEITVSGSRVTTITTDRSTGISTRSTPALQAAAGRSFFIIDRKTGKSHSTGVSSGTSWKLILKTWLKKLDSERKKNESK